MPILSDKYANIVGDIVTTSAADALTFGEINTGISLAQRLGLVIDEVRYFPAQAAIRELEADTDHLVMGLVSSNSVTDLLDMTDPRIIDQAMLTASLIGTAGNLNVQETPIKSQLSPPIIVATPRLYFALDTAGASTTISCRFRLHYRYVSLDRDEYLEIAETFIMLQG